MSKIKNIKINDFRIYNEEQEFSFVNDESISNLMVIYAPNGFGKTSFFDAVEWCYASKLRRFESDVLGQEINRRDYSSGDKILLTNRQGYKNGKSGSVKILTTDDKVIERTATERKAKNFEYKYDYRTVSSLNSDYAQDVLDRLVKTNILTQDQIDEFLRHTKPDERFFQLQNFWPEGESALSILKKIDSYQNMLTIEKSEIISNIDNAKKQIKDFLNAGDQIGPINAAIQELTEKTSTEFKMEALASNVNRETYQVILSTTQTYIERAKLIEQRAFAQISMLEALQKAMPEYHIWLKSHPILNEDFNKLSELEKLYTDLNTYNASGNSMEANFLIISNSSQKITRLLSLVSEVDTIYKNITQQQNVLHDFRRDIDKHLYQLQTSKSSNLVLQSTLEEWEQQRDALDRKLKEWDTELENYRFWNTDAEKRRAKIKELNEQLSEKESALSLKLSSRQLLQSIAESKGFESLPVQDKEKLSYDFTIRNELVKHLLANKINIDKLQNDLDNSANLDEIFDRVIEWGEDYVRKTDINHCPLCATDFNEVSNLLAKIEEQKTSKTITVTLKSQLDIAKSDEILIKEKIGALDQKFLTFINQEIELCNTEISKLQIERDKTSSEITNVQSALQNSTRSVNLSLLQLRPETTVDDLNTPLDFETIKSEMKSKLSKIRLRFLRLENVVKYRSQKISSIENDISILKNRISTAENNIAISRADRLLVEAEQLVKELNLPSDSFHQIELQRRLDEITHQLTKAQNEKLENEAKIAEIRHNISSFSIQYNEAEIPGLKIVKNNEINDIQQKTSTYINQFKQFSQDGEPSEEFFRNELEILKLYHQNLIIEVKDLENLAVSLKVIEKNVLKNTLEKDLEKWELQIKPLDDSLDKVIEARKTSETYINGEINKYFNQEVINQIYSRIEPHPNLNQIKISPKVTEKGPILNIKAISNDEELDPSLYLSAGQLNVLSLSIFLAKAFETRNDEIDTIFMDDPIQNLSDINILSFIDLIRTMITKYNRQIVISSHDENFYKLMRNKMPSDAFNVRYYEIQSFGKATHVK
ncbi:MULTISPECIES: AAA family ATPase [Chryseobacterium]|uniref:ATPase involved in DNA repair n=1 Tax=Chryseobacterium balustinum TaxID=246 RepID=A0AAX2IMD1_9FLAO|nr:MULTISPECIES: AAA family ATPase [Chryseobacterium]AZB30295.1 hypothetical protein EB354_14095 [Chryseobacterium balustinum]OBW43583.1 hypothetical protein AB670_00113 [Chryseobacterium sp. MOF25P]OBW46643.1 hypothetical protein AB671_01138 [Chryseobacterium sp. BGARF1]SKC03154.1 DNA repair exonuclease SbcCD ATPase subunit [Chryseobacterium balustinum]SQA90931.1 ATPase involved in DNA repair [Chryseobacterium balustinum]